MIGLLDLSVIGIFALGVAIAIILFNIPQLRFLLMNPFGLIVTFVIGIGVAYFLDDYGTGLQPDDWIAIVALIVTNTITIIGWKRGEKKYKKRISRLEKRYVQLETRVKMLERK